MTTDNLHPYILLRDRLPKIRQILATPYTVFPPNLLLALMDVLMSYKRDMYFHKTANKQMYQEEAELIARTPPDKRAYVHSGGHELCKQLRDMEQGCLTESVEHQELLEMYVKQHIPKRRVQPLFSFRPQEDFRTDLGLLLVEGAEIALHPHQMGKFVKHTFDRGYITNVESKTRADSKIDGSSYRHTVIDILYEGEIFKAATHDSGTFMRSFPKEGCTLAVFSHATRFLSYPMVRSLAKVQSVISYFSVPYIDGRREVSNQMKTLSPQLRLISTDLQRRYEEMFGTSIYPPDRYVAWSIAQGLNFLSANLEAEGRWHQLKPTVPFTPRRKTDGGWGS